MLDKHRYTVGAISISFLDFGHKPFGDLEFIQLSHLAWFSGRKGHSVYSVKTFVENLFKHIQYEYISIPPPPPRHRKVEG